jgi:hypothetical protein
LSPPAAIATATTLAVALTIAACGNDPAPRAPICEQSRPGALLRRAPSPSLQTSQCGPTQDFTPINQYHGQIASIQDREDAVVLISGDCTGTLIAAAAGPVVLTAGHCVNLGDQPLIAFNVEAAPDGDPLVTNGTVIEQALDPDYALIKLDHPSTATPIALTTRTTDLLAIIQHPFGRPKVIAEGSFAAACNGQLYYTDLDTLEGSSGAAVLNDQGYAVGVHTDGDCAKDGSGDNRGFTAARIVEASPYLVDGDIADR